MQSEMDSPLVSNGRASVADDECGGEPPLANIMRSLVARAPTGFVNSTKASLRRGYDDMSCVRVLQYVHGAMVSLEEDSTFSLWDHERATCLVRTKLPYCGADGAALVVGGGIADGHVLVARGSTLDAYDLDVLRKPDGEECLTASQPDYSHTFDAPITHFSIDGPYWPVRHVHVGLEGGGVVLGRRTAGTGRAMAFDFTHTDGAATGLAEVNHIVSCGGVVYAAGLLPSGDAERERRDGRSAVVPIQMSTGDITHPEGGLAKSTGEIVGVVGGMAVYEGHSLIVAAKNLSVWSISEDGPFMKKRFMRLWGTFDPHQGSECVGVQLHANGVGVTAGADGSLKVWNFGKSSCAMPFVMRVLPPFDNPLHCLAVGCIDGSAASDCWTCFAVAGSFKAVHEWETEVAFAGKDQPGLKTPNGSLVPIAHHMPPTKVFARAEMLPLALCLVALVVTIAQFLGLPFVDDAAWVSEVDPLSQTLPVANLQVSFSKEVYEVVFWVICAMVLLFAVFFLYGTVDKLRIKAARVNGMANGNWPALNSKNPDEVREAEEMIASLRKQHASLEKRVMIVWRYMWAMSGMFLLPMVGKLSETYACEDMLLNITRSDGTMVVETRSVWTAVLLNDDFIECYTAYHWWKMVVAAACLACLSVFALRIALVGGDARLLCRYAISEATGEPRPSLANRLWRGPFTVRSASTLPPRLRPFVSSAWYSLMEAATKIAVGMVSSVVVNQGATTARTVAYVLVGTYSTLLLTRLRMRYYADSRTEQWIFALVTLAVFAAVCRLCTVLAYIASEDNSAQGWPMYLWYVGALPALIVGYFVHRAAGKKVAGSDTVRDVDAVM